MKEQTVRAYGEGSAALRTQHPYRLGPGHRITVRQSTCLLAALGTFTVYSVPPGDSHCDFVCSLLSSKTAVSRELPGWSPRPELQLPVKMYFSFHPINV